MRRVFNYPVYFLLLILTLQSCDNSPEPDDQNSNNPEDTPKELTIFFVNDQHGQLDDFAKIKYLVDQEKELNPTLLVCAGDMFSGNPIVDQYNEKGFPMIDIMNKTGFDVAVLGNHEFDYGIEVLKKRMSEAEFSWICANVDMLNSGVPQPDPYVTLDLDSLKVTFLGLVETYGKPDDIIPSTHPWRVAELDFDRHYNVLPDYEGLKETEETDLVIALTHLGTNSDMSIAEDFPFLDAVIGGHSHDVVDEVVNGTPVVQAGAYLSVLGRMKLTIVEKAVVESEVEMINLNAVEEEDDELADLIADYNNAPEFDEVVGFSESYHTRNEIGCFYTRALKEYFNVDASFQNGGGIRADIDEGDITALEIYNMDPFNNQSAIFTLRAEEIKAFFRETGAGMHISGISFERSSAGYFLYDSNGELVEDEEEITIGINDYIPAVYDEYFPLEKAQLQNITTAEVIIEYLKEVNTIDYDNCNQYYDYD